MIKHLLVVACGRTLLADFINLSPAAGLTDFPDTSIRLLLVPSRPEYV